MEQMIPGFLEEMLKKQYGEEAFAKILAGYQARRPVTLRVNPLKADRNTVEQALTGAGIAFKNVSWYEDAMIIEDAREPEIQELPIYQEGGIYLQSLSSMLPPLFLDPKAGESVLDMAAAPGGKTTQMAAMTGNQAQITACEKNKARSEKLKYNLEKQGAFGTYVMVEDARFLFLRPDPLRCALQRKRNRRSAGRRLPDKDLKGTCGKIRKNAGRTVKKSAEAFKIRP